MLGNKVSCCNKKCKLLIGKSTSKSGSKIIPSESRSLSRRSKDFQGVTPLSSADISSQDSSGTLKCYNISSVPLSPTPALFLPNTKNFRSIFVLMNPREN